jgi:hypothetical protein
MGLVMILTGLLGLVCDLATNLVTTAYYNRRCSFMTGIVVSDYNSGRYPSPNGAAALYTQAAQLNTVSTFDLNNHHGLQGMILPKSTSSLPLKTTLLACGSAKIHRKYCFSRTNPTTPLHRS